MTDQVETLLSLETSPDRRAWLNRHAPTRDEPLIAALRQEAYRRERDNPHTALLVAEAVADAAVVWQDDETGAVALLIEANARRLLAEHTRALELYERAAAVYRSLGLELEAARAVVGQLDAMMYLGRYAAALDLADWAGQVFRDAGDQLALGKMTLNRGNIFARLDRYSEAQASYAEARAVFSAIGDSRHLAMVEANEANVLTNLDDFRQAEDLFKQARSHFESEGMTSAIAQVDDSLAYLYFAQGDYQWALATFKQAREIFAAQDDAVRVAYVDLHRSDIYLALNLWQEALQMARAARETFERANMPWETARLWLTEAAALAHTGGGAAPGDALDRARRLFAEEQNAVWLAVTDLYQATFDWRGRRLAPAQERARRARDTFRQAALRSRAAQCEIILGEIALLQGDAAQAAHYFSQGLEAVAGADLPAVAYAARFGLGRACQQQGQTAAALTHFRQAVSDIERLQTAIGAEDYKIAFLSDKLQVYEALILLCLSLGTPAGEREAFETVERAKSRALLDALARETPAPSASPAEADLLVELARLKSELNWFYNRLNEPLPAHSGRSAGQVARLTAEITWREQALSRLLNRWRSPDLATASRNPVWTVTPDQMQAALPPETLLLEFYLARGQVIVFGLSAETMWTEWLPAAEAEVADALGQLRFQMNKFSYNPAYLERHAGALRQGADDCLQRLYRALLAPIAGRLTAETLLIVPHGLLHYVPFQALFDGEGYLIDTKTVSYAPSATILHRVLTGDAPAAAEPPLILGLPDKGIPHVRAEVEAIAGLFPGAGVHLGEQATVDRLARNRRSPAFLHLATHARFRADNPLFSALKLADGWLSVNDIYAMGGSAPLVTLSACETGRNQVAVGDELVGLCRGFFSAGAKSLVVSLWTVDDSSTAGLMTAFYQALQTGQPANRALRSAQIVVKSELGHPYFWAPFILTGSIHTRLPALWTS